MVDVRQKLDDFMNGLGGIKESSPANGETVGAFFGLLGADGADGAISAKNKELISIGISVYARCEYCICFHVHNAYKLGATKDEILEAGLVSWMFGAGPSATYSSTVLLDAANEFEHDFE